MTFSIFDQGYHSRERFPLTFHVIGSSYGGANVEPPYHLPRWPCGTTEWRHDTNQCCRDTFCFQPSRNQTHGLMADGSAGYQQSGLYIVGLERRQNFRNGLVNQRVHIRLQTHKHQRFIGERTDDTFFH